MSKMGFLGAIGFSLALVSLSQIHHSAEGCKILSATSSSAASFFVKWEKFPGATSYFLDLRKKNSSDSAPVVVTMSPDKTEKYVHGLKPGTEYSVTLKVFMFYFVECVNSTSAITVPDTSQILNSWASSSTSITVTWKTVPSAESYCLEVYSQDTGEMVNYTLTNTSATVGNLQPSSNYDCYVITMNQGGKGEKSKVRTIRTLQSPPMGVTVEQTGQDTARITWQPVEDVLLYKVTIWNLDDPTSQPSMHNVSDTKLDIDGILPCTEYLIAVSSFSMFLLPSEPTEYMYTTNKLTPVSSVSVDYTCTSNSVMVSWLAVYGADSYTATAMNENGTQMSCTSNHTNCWITGMSCGQIYVVHVTPISENCKNVVNATSATFHTVPCPPSGLMLVRECTSHAILFSWNHTHYADYYMAKAVDSKGVVQDCLTEENSCYFTHTVCGRYYDFTVYSIADGCKSEISSTVGIRTAPCIPQNLQTSANCSSEALLSKWDHAEGALHYTVNATGNKKNSSYSCSTQTNSCVMEGVHCGEHLTISITAYDDECFSPEMLGHPAETVPCTPQNISAVKECGSDSISVTWSIFSHALFYIAIAEDSDGVMHSCNSVQMSCNIDGLMCGTAYKVYVIASNFLCNSSVSDIVTVDTAACPPDNLTASLDCAANEALISWHGQHNMNSYTATIVDEGQGLLSCSSTTTSCAIPNLKCGQLYTVTVSYHDGICPSMPSEPIHMESVPCGPANLNASVNCTSGEATICWNETKNAEGYITVISDGNMQMAFNTTEPKLSVNTLQCGQEYTVEVMSVNGSCVSLSSETNLKEVPCVPTNVTVKRNCGKSYAEVMWQASRGAKNYTVTAEDEDGNRLECVSNMTWCRLEDTMCGKAYSVSVVAVDDTCSSTKSPTVELLTEPCPPTEPMATVNCSGNSAMLTWKSSPNAVSYAGRAVGTDGHNVTCDAGMNLRCQLEGLHCGEEYAFAVSASDGYCQSPDSEPVIHTTAPCAVQNVNTTLSCTTNTLTVSWMPGSMPVNYSVTAVTANGTALRCVTEGSGCTIRDLQCGQQYTVTVTPMSSTCEGHSSPPQTVNSVPCVPMKVQGMVECSTNTLKASWDAAPGAQSYVTTLTGAGGSSASCHTANQSCHFPALQCAQTYMYRVVALNDRCNSSKSAMMTATTAPCDPTHVTASLNCLSGVATVIWRASAGANNYTVIAEASGHMDSCHSPGTSCELSQLQCGEDYTVTVLAGDGKCNSSLLARTNLTTAPCAPMIHNHSLDCASNHAWVSWDKDEDAMNVTVTATSTLGDSQSCSSSINNSCVMDKLKCGHTYTAHAVAHGVQCLSKPSSDFQIVTAPCTPANVDHTYSCGTGIAFVSWDETLGRKSFHVYAHSGNHTASCHAQQTDCSLPSLLCGQLYEVEVTAVADHCNSSRPGVTQIQTAPCAPKNVSTYLVCDNNTAAVSWQHSPGAVSYTVMARGRDGDVKQCTTNGTTCPLPNMHCAQVYFITVTPSSQWCQGDESSTHAYTAGPCPPTDVHATLQCVGNVGHVTWTAAPMADMYEATALPSAMDQHDHRCSSSGTNCSLTDLYCGKTVSISVVTIERGCRSEPSMPYTFQSVICPPTNVTGVTNCTSNDITVGWDPSPESGVDYFIYSKEDSGPVANFSTTQTSHMISGLQCGQRYSIKVAARDSECSSVFSQQMQTETAPCPPTNLTVKTECATNMAVFTWAPSALAISYTVTVTGDHGDVASCSSNTTTCSVHVDCGHQYTAVMVASSATCNSSASASLAFDSAPCLPDSVQAQLDCNANSFAVQWRTLDDGGMYTAIAIGSDGSRETCDSASTNCTINNLKCGLIYSIVVTMSSVNCGTISGSNYKLQSAPCKPDMVSVDLQCSTNVALVTWQNSGPDQSQQVLAVDNRETMFTCNSNSSNCTFDQLECGRTYTVSVVGFTETCRSEPALADPLKTAPCVPTQPTARVDCGSGITSVTWDGSLGATSYTVYARGSLGHNDHWDGTDTTCAFPALACGQDYNFTVVARHDTCDSMDSKTITESTGPCPQTDLKTKLHCSTNAVEVSWTPGSGILYYNASADSFAIAHHETCTTNGSTCNITSLHCGQSYTVRVSGQGQTCPSPAHYFDRVNTAPCPPTQLKINSSCESNNISVSWDASQGSVSYMTVVENAQGNRWTCNTTGTTCDVSGLLCGQEYKVYVVGIDEMCTGAKSEMKMIRTAPCVPENVQNHLDCLSGVLNVTWQSTGHYLKFRASVMSSRGHVSICTTNKHHCVVRNLQCGLTYNVTVVAQDENCNSSHSPVKQISSAPCPLPSFHPVVNCSSGDVSVTWSNSVPGVTYTVFAIDAMGYRHNCSDTNSGCTLNTLKCGTEYNVTITPSRGDCVGRDSQTKMIMTVPCVPHLSDVEIDCLANSAWVMYNYSAGAKDYIVMATDSQGNVQTFECNSTSDWMCALPPLMCSKNLTFTLKAQDQQCTSAPSNAITAETAPCPPINVRESVDCENGTISVTWSDVPGAITYTATLEEVSGSDTTCCTTPGTGCNITDLPCGEMYILHVTAEGRTCNSSESESLITRTAPCVPEDLKANLSCSNNVASMSWSNSDGGQLYRVKAVADDGHMHECSSHENQCDLTDLHCGEYYTATVTAEDSECMSKPSDSVMIKTVPCTPANASSMMDCQTNSLIIYWSDSPGADSYLATLEDSTGRGTTCQGTTEGSCNVTGLACGQIYHVSVVSSDGYCNSPPTPVTDTPSVPCKPRHIKAVIDCYTDSALVEWYLSYGALWYMVTANTASGHTVTCQTNMTYCELKGLRCGQSYTVSVKAVGESCSSMADMMEQLVTAPCIPEHITTQYSLTIGQVQWDMTLGAKYYTVNAETDEGLASTCITNDTSCALNNMKCSQMYSVEVTANNHVCKGVSTSTEAVTILTEPCPPDNVQTTVNCQENQGTVSWEASIGAVAYEVTLAGRDGHVLTCLTNNTYCDVEGLHCGVTYLTNVVAASERLNSFVSDTVLLVAAPCAAGNVAAELDCYNNTALVSWNSARGGISYMVTAVSREGYQASCEADDLDLQCDLTELHCGQTYYITVTSIGDHCQTETHTEVTFTTRPCRPMYVGVDLQCGTSTANLYWEENEGVELYMATATCSNGMTLQCNSTNSTCLFSDLNCAETYEFSVTAYSNMCYSETSSTVEIQTEPCQPTGLTVSGSCYNATQTVKVEWFDAPGALLYVLTASGDLGFSTAFQTNETVIEADLPCGQVYTFIVIAQDNRCDSAASIPEQYKTGPCIPEHVQSFTRCEDSVGAVSFATSPGAESYVAVATGQDGHTHMCTTNTSTCFFDDLHCGEVYTVHVIAIDYLCNSMPSNSTSIRMAPCIPQNLMSSFNCSMKVGSLSWNATETAKSYIVTAENIDGHKVSLSTNETWTYISEFMCGQEYFLSVQATDFVCTSRPSPPSVLQSEPCPPTDVSSFMNCMSNIAMVSWTGSAGGKYYTATLTPEDGQPYSCMSDGQQCSLPNVQCGQNYTVTVVASDMNCDSDPSEPDNLQSVPCVPTDVDVQIDCSKNEVVVYWSAGDGALSYKVVAQSTQGSVSFCETTDRMCTLTNLTCGHHYSVQVVAQDDICSSLPSPTVYFYSVPCTPDIGSVILDCYTNSALLDWAYSEGAMSYNATAWSSTGHVSTCRTNFTFCELPGLQCGETYNLFTVASNDQCSSPHSMSLQLESVPCPPEDVMPVLDCATNTAHIEWQRRDDADLYIVQAIGVEEHMTGCETATESCVLSDLKCGFTYNISVIAVNHVCNVSQSEVKQLKTAPCIPQRAEARVDCESGGVAVSWERSKGGTHYTSVAQGNGGYASTCNSSETTCLFNDLLCGLNYSITVSASNGMCSSAESSAVDIDTVPCVPQNVTAEMMCSSDTGVVSWEAGEGVSSYKVRAFGPDGHKVECHSTEGSCQLPSMHCGQLYNLTVTAQDGRCNNSHAYLTLQSVPCQPTSVKASLRCHSNSVAVTWEQSSGGRSYVAVAVAADGSHQTECNNTMTYCDLTDLQCGQTYNISVFSQDKSCSSVASDRAYVRTAPCAPQNVTVDAQCDEGAMVVSWSPNPDARYFHVAAVSNTMARLYCNSSGTMCTLNNLPCGQSYNVTVLSVRDDCESKPSRVVETSSVPCVPMNSKGDLDCVSNSAWVVWDDSKGATSYFVLAQSAGGHSSNCTASSSHCNVPDLECGTLYTFHVTAMNKHCSSNHSTTFEIETGPCALTSVNATTECHNDTILVEWENTVDMPLYLVTAEADDQTTISCKSTSNKCLLENVVCGTHYSIIVSASSDKCSTLRSPPKKIKTAPCAPGNVTAVPSCEENVATVTWTKSPVARSYHLTATGEDGHVVNCSSSVNNCSLADLHCGQMYNFSITATGDDCTSYPSTSSFRTVPCAPSGLAVDLDCHTNSAMLSWNASEGAMEYFSCAQPMEGDALYCGSSNTSCTFDGLECGDIYNFSVQASNGICNSSFSPPLQMGAAPCPPTYLNVRMQRIDETFWAMISWDRVNCSDVQYLVELIGRINNNPQTLMNISSYWLPLPYFEFPMPCSTAYNVTVRSKNSAGVSEPSSVFSGVTVPCPPQNIRYTGDRQSAVLSWDASVFATWYTVTSVVDGVRGTLCNTTEFSCVVSDFNPNATEVTASNDVGESNPNGNITGPMGARRRRDLRTTQVFARLEENLEMPEELTVTAKGVSLYVKWKAVKGVTEYTLVINEKPREERSSPTPVVRSVEGTSHRETGLKPWTRYCVKVAAKNVLNQSNYSHKCTNTTAS